MKLKIQDKLKHTSSGITLILCSAMICICSFSCKKPDTVLSPEEISISSNVKADQFEVSVGEFREFVDATSYVTTADSFEWSGIFDYSIKDWKIGQNANWLRHDGETEADDEMPVVHVSYYDACAYCKWKGGRLPTADEWDHIAGDTVIVGNVWQGIFPEVDSGDDGYVVKAAPRGQFAPNVNGYYDIFGNVWEWTTSMDLNKGERIIKGGSFLCDYDFCMGYIPSRYQTTADDSGLNHLGFRCVYSL